MTTSTDLGYSLLLTLTSDTFNNRPLKTTSLLRSTGIPTTQRSQCLTILHALTDAHLILRHGKGNYRWMAVVMPMRDEISKALKEVDRAPKHVRVDPSPSADFEALLSRLEWVDRELKELRAGQGTKSKNITITINDEAIDLPEGTVVPETFADVLTLSKLRKNVLLVGPAGCGKTHQGELVAQTLGLRFASVGCSDEMTESHLLGRSVPNLTTGTSKFIGTEFLNIYEQGGIFLLDELDGANSNVLLTINSALANGYCNVPSRVEAPRAERHPDFVMIATANTFGRGADRMYVGRNQLDASTLDRFAIGTIDCYYDDAVEASVCPDARLRGVLKQIRTNIEAHILRRVMSTRFMKDAYSMHTQAGWSIEKIVEIFFRGWPKTEVDKCRPTIPKEVSDDGIETPFDAEEKDNSPSVIFSSSAMNTINADFLTITSSSFKLRDFINDDNVQWMEGHDIPPTDMLKGSPKQIAYASDIRHRIVHGIRQVEGDEWVPTLEISKDIPAATTALQRVRSAKAIIEWYVKAMEDQKKS